MDKDSYNGFLALHSHPVVEQLAAIRKIPKRKALDLFYGSNTYRLYEHEKTKLWHFSHVTLADMINQEISTGHTEFPVEG